MSRSFRIVFAFLFLSFGTSTIAETDGNELLDRCTLGLIEDSSNHTNAQLMNATWCMGLMEGMTSLNQYYHVALDGKVFFCLPVKGINNKQAMRVVVKYLKEHPERLHLSSHDLVLDALTEAFPCEDPLIR